jgi:hypothetical protein
MCVTFYYKLNGLFINVTFSDDYEQSECQAERLQIKQIKRKRASHSVHLQKSYAWSPSKFSFASVAELPMPPCDSPMRVSAQKID